MTSCRLDLTHTDVVVAVGVEAAAGWSVQCQRGCQLLSTLTQSVAAALCRLLWMLLAPSMTADTPQGTVQGHRRSLLTDVSVWCCLHMLACQYWLSSSAVSGCKSTNVQLDGSDENDGVGALAVNTWTSATILLKCWWNMSTPVTSDSRTQPRPSVRRWIARAVSSPEWFLLSTD